MASSMQRAVSATRMAHLTFGLVLKRRSGGSTLFNIARFKTKAQPLAVPLPVTMSAWQIYGYGGLDKLTLSDTVRMPVIRRPEEVLVKVHAASINPIDVAMLGGYGYNALNLFRRVNGTLSSGSEFPLILGRDFSGQIVGVGKSVDRQKFQLGDEVWGAGNVAYQGTFAQYVVISSNEVSRKPQALSHVEAGSLPYVAATTWAAIRTVGQFTERNLRRKRVLVVGASGGIGTFAIQLLKSWGANVTAMCGPDSAERVLHLGADIAVDYTQQDVWKELEQAEKFDLVFDVAAGQTENRSSRVLNKGGMYLTIITPFLRNTDMYGFARGTVQTVAQLGVGATKAIFSGINKRWALFMPSGEAMHAVAKLVDDRRIVPLIERVYSFNDLPLAFEKVSAKHNRGKTVLDFKDLVAKTQ